MGGVVWNDVLTIKNEEVHHDAENSGFNGDGGCSWLW